MEFPITFTLITSKRIRRKNPRVCIIATIAWVTETCFLTIFLVQWNFQMLTYELFVWTFKVVKLLKHGKMSSLIDTLTDWDEIETCFANKAMIKIPEINEGKIIDCIFELDWLWYFWKTHIAYESGWLPHQPEKKIPILVKTWFSDVIKCVGWLIRAFSSISQHRFVDHLIFSETKHFTFRLGNGKWVYTSAPNLNIAYPRTRPYHSCSSFAS